jgi:hypothetical protein
MVLNPAVKSNVSRCVRERKRMRCGTGKQSLQGKDDTTTRPKRKSGRRRRAYLELVRHVAKVDLPIVDLEPETIVTDLRIDLSLKCDVSVPDQLRETIQRVS